MTTIVINSISVREGGSLVVLRELLSNMSVIQPQWKWFVVTNSAVSDLLPTLPNVEYLKFPEIDQSGLHTRLWYEAGLPTLLKHVSANVLFSMTNYLPIRHMPCPTLLLVQHAGHFSPLFRQLTEEQLGVLGRIGWRLKGHWVKSSVRKASMVTVQTAALAKEIVQQTTIPIDRIRIIPHGIGQVDTPITYVEHPHQKTTIRIGYITKYGVQKNFPILFDAIKKLKNNGLIITLVLTLAEDKDENRALLELADHYGISDCIENHGELGRTEIGQLYKSLHVFVFPSLCESFGFPMVEAMAHGLPLLVADTNSNIEIAGSGARSFPGDNPNILAEELTKLITNVDWYRQQAQASMARGLEYKWKKSALETVALIENVISGVSEKRLNT